MIKKYKLFRALVRRGENEFKAVVFVPNLKSKKHYILTNNSILSGSIPEKEHYELYKEIRTKLRLDYSWVTHKIGDNMWNCDIQSIVEIKKERYTLPNQEEVFLSYDYNDFTVKFIDDNNVVLFALPMKDFKYENDI